jgi:hypothetical protein
MGSEHPRVASRGEGTELQISSGVKRKRRKRLLVPEIKSFDFSCELDQSSLQPRILHDAFVGYRESQPVLSSKGTATLVKPSGSVIEAW